MHIKDTLYFQRKQLRVALFRLFNEIEKYFIPYVDWLNNKLK